MHTGSDPVCTPWASQVIERNGKWYWYVAAEDTTKHLHGIGVAVADRPEGPWADPIGRPLIPGDWGFIDPTVFIDDDGQAWLFWRQRLPPLHHLPRIPAPEGRSHPQDRHLRTSREEMTFGTI